MSSKLDLLNIINQFLIQKGESLQEEEVTLHPPVKLSEVVARAYDRNTRIKISSIADPEDVAVVYYNRLDLPILFGAEQVPVDIDFYTVEEAVARLNSLYDIEIEMGDLKNFEMLTGYKAKIVIGQSYKFIEDSELIIYPKTDLTYIEDFSDRFHNYIHFTLPTTLEGVPDE